ncbi:MAG TPA: hypothetical protein VFF63_03215 [Candidatus Babeliales bacterium]|nr:hypothetical protein [Candidatus Babeliales bacterium]
MPKPTPSVSPPPPANVLPYDSTLLFVLDDPISSQGSKPGEVVRAHLKNAIVVGSRVIAAAGAPATIRIVDASPSEIMDVYGFVDIFFEPLALSDGRDLPLRAPVSRLEPRISSGHESTVAAEDTAGDIFVPYYPLWQIMRKGKNFVMGAGSVIPAKTEATLTAQSNGSIAIVTPAPPDQGQPAAATFPLSPLATPFGPAGTTPHSRSAPQPSPSPSPTESPSSTPT